MSHHLFTDDPFVPINLLIADAAVSDAPILWVFRNIVAFYAAQSPLV